MRAVTAIACLLLAVATQLLAEGRGPSTPQERADAIKLVRLLESDPLNKAAKDARSNLTMWLIAVPDIEVPMCPNIAGPILDESKNYANEIAMQQSYSSAAFIIENPDKAKDRVQVILAGVEGMLKTYEAILKDKPKAKRPYLDELVIKRNKGELAAYVAANIDKCK